MIWSTLLNPSLDITYTLPKFILGKTFLDTKHEAILAGKGLNVAKTIRDLGEEAGVCGIVPELDKSKIISSLEKSKILHHLLTVPGCLRINTTIIEEESGTSTHINSLSQRVPERIKYDFLSFAQRYMEKDDLWCFCGSIIEGIEEDIYYSLITLAKEKGIATILDSRGDVLKHGVRAQPLLIKPNHEELEDFFEEKINGIRHIALKGKKFLDLGIEYVFISLGSDGMIALHKNDCILCTPPQVRGLNSVGCGDAMVAGIAVALKRKFSFSETCRMAIACGTAKAITESGKSIDKEKVWKLMEEVKIEAV
ncbi:MAG: 1-phosphofructokinase family hexose kinase [Chitinispirillaceae bacterium]|nr:1-phosphofructokinase family hexose kinase [Chitinispirillaceae bacterium]